MTELKVIDFLNGLPKGETVYYRSNPGNAGDALIASGAYKLFDDAGLKVKLVNPDSFDSTNKIVIYAGGGNLVGIYPEARDFFLKHHRTAKQLILLPHTVAKNEDLLAELGPNVTLFARELVTLKHLKKHCSNTNIYLDHDLAFNLNPDDILKQSHLSLAKVVYRKTLSKCNGNSSSRFLPRPQIMIRNSIYEAKRRFFPFESNHAMFFRTDTEALDGPSIERKDDLSRIYEYGTQYRSLTDYTVTRLMKFISQFEEVSTDRLHIAIAAHLLGKQVNFYSNSYFKCKAVYDFSLANAPNVRWLGIRSKKEKN